MKGNLAFVIDLMKSLADRKCGGSAAVPLLMAMKRLSKSSLDENVVDRISVYVSEQVQASPVIMAEAPANRREVHNQRQREDLEYIYGTVRQEIYRHAGKDAVAEEIAPQTQHII